MFRCRDRNNNFNYLNSNDMEIKTYIDKAVNNEFESTYARNLSKAWLYSYILNKNFSEVGVLILENRRKASDYVNFVGMVIAGKTTLRGFDYKFMRVKEACEKYAIDKVNKDYALASINRIKRVREEIILNLNVCNN